ncbi:MAG: hypothetical protein PF503_08415 [Desulfobacula sp.]|jgi:hypothetical protein|nr:hypothetical protein [Desulfobacula sp.]
MNAHRTMEEKDIEKLIVQNNAFTMEIKDLYEKVSNLRISEKFLEKNLKNEKLAINKVRSKLAECEAKLKREQERLKDRISEQEKVHTAQQERLKDRINKFEKKVFALNTSYSFRIGQAFVNAVGKPGKNTIMLPFRFVSLIFEFVFARKDK